jgi:hypothetical protein
MICDFYFRSLIGPPTSTVNVDEAGRIESRPNLCYVSCAVFAETWSFNYTPSTTFEVKMFKWELRGFYTLCRTLNVICGIVVTALRVQLERRQSNDASGIRNVITSHLVDGFPLFDLDMQWLRQ